MSVIQHNTRGRVFMLSHAASTTLANPHMGNTRSLPADASYTLSIVRQWQQFRQQRQWFQTIRDEQKRTAHPLSERPGLLQARPKAGQKSRYREFDSSSSHHRCAVEIGFCSLYITTDVSGFQAFRHEILIVVSPNPLIKSIEEIRFLSLVLIERRLPIRLILEFTNTFFMGPG